MSKRVSHSKLKKIRGGASSSTVQSTVKTAPSPAPIAKQMKVNSRPASTVKLNTGTAKEDGTVMCTY